ncbi:TPM domain-containing protein [Viridibacillus sp. YIM B01967]|uniref:TPM domain-containing protein n=1 Tax=Viridibacillus soli TaxID=2798301 RepID=A0ABS1H9D3_9BACL|nr:TPM domain-containing protein [Viridibacillus soli]MBK3496015.1 TPM domain-containing protein [Viridibacillus soli]
MKKIHLVIGLLFAWMLVFITSATTQAATLPKPEQGGYVQDFAGVLSTDTKNELNELSKKLEQGTGAQIVVLTVDTLDGMDAASYGTKIIRKWGIGGKEKNNGVLILASFGDAEGDRDLHITVGQGLEGALPDGKIGRILDEYMVPNLREGNYDAAFSSAYKLIYNIVAEEYNWDGTVENPEKPEEEGFSPLMIILIVIAVLIVYSMISKGGGGSGGSGGRRRRTYDYGGMGSGWGSFNSSGRGRSGGSGFGGFTGGGGSSAGGGAGRKW